MTEGNNKPTIDEEVTSFSLLPVSDSDDDEELDDEELEEDYEDLEEGHDMATVTGPPEKEGSDAKNKTSPSAGANPMDSGGRSAVKIKDGSEGDHGTSGVSEDNVGNINTVPGKADGDGGNAAPSAKESEGSDAKNKKSPISTTVR